MVICLAVVTILVVGGVAQATLTLQDGYRIDASSEGSVRYKDLLGTNNNDKMFAYNFTSNIQSKVAMTEKDRFAEISYKDGRKEKRENNIGSGYLSQGSKTISFIPNLVDKVVITDYLGQQRTVFQGQAIASK